jgi:VIT1/CCC1 family predicted Fe2+/Mn2+ transporter
MLKIKQSLKTGVSFGLTSGIITTLGLLVGLSSGTHSKTAVLGGILIIAIADSMSDALGIHMSEESDRNKNHREIWESTFSTFIAKFLTALTFVLPVLIFDLSLAVIFCIVWGFTLIAILSSIIAKQHKENIKEVLIEHLTITILVVFFTHFLGNLISRMGL